MTSPVDCMPGPTDGSTPRSLAVEKAGALTATNGGGGEQPAGPAELGQRRAERDPDRQLDHRHAGHLRHERHGPRGARVDLDQVDAVVADDELGVDEARGRRAPARSAPSSRRSASWSPSLTVCGGNIADRVAAVDAGPLDVLEEARDQHALAVARRRRRRPRRPRGSGRCGPAGRGRRRSRRRAGGRGPRASSRSRWRGRR